MDDHGRPRVLLLSAGNTNDITMAHALIEAAGTFQKLLADRGYDADHLRKRLSERNAEAVIPTTTSRKRPIPDEIVARKEHVADRPRTAEKMLVKHADRSVARLVGEVDPQDLAQILLIAKAAYPLRHRRLPAAQHRRTPLGPAQGLSPRRYPLRQARRQLPLRRPYRRNRLLLGQMSPDPRRFPRARVSR